MQVGDLSAPQLRFKVDVNARENHMSGASLALAGTFALVVVEGTQKTLRRCALLVGRFALACLLLVCSCAVVAAAGSPYRWVRAASNAAQLSVAGADIWNWSVAVCQKLRRSTPACLCNSIELHPPLPCPHARRYEKLMLRRIDWNVGRDEEEEEEEEGKPPRPPNYCHLVWQVGGAGRGGWQAIPEGICCRPTAAALFGRWAADRGARKLVAMEPFAMCPAALHAAHCPRFLSTLARQGLVKEAAFRRLASSPFLLRLTFRCCASNFIAGRGQAGHVPQVLQSHAATAYLRCAFYTDAVLCCSCLQGVVKEATFRKFYSETVHSEAAARTFLRVGASCQPACLAVLVSVGWMLLGRVVGSGMGSLVASEVGSSCCWGGTAIASLLLFVGLTRTVSQPAMPCCRTMGWSTTGSCARPSSRSDALSRHSGRGSSCLN